MAGHGPCEWVQQLLNTPEGSAAARCRPLQAPSLRRKKYGDEAWRFCQQVCKRHTLALYLSCLHTPPVAPPPFIAKGLYAAPSPAAVVHPAAQTHF